MEDICLVLLWLSKRDLETSGLGKIPGSILCVVPFLADFLYSFVARGRRRVQHDSGSAKDPNGPIRAPFMDPGS